MYRTHYDGMIRLAYVITDSMATAEDIVQEAFVELYRRWPTVRDPESWLHTVVVNRSRSWWRRLVVARRHVARGSPPESSPSTEDGAAVRQALLALNRRQRAAVFFRFYLDLPEVAIAEALGCRPGTVKSLLHRALATLREHLDED
ncbi:SigE family RNA polymerase sigma factor [Micromonospora sp. CPCC 206061]|uniref:SigE family RNA polymerase sigma factor n=1 Tax=Micromonospora sp. CPCC 206061 TaxID=3122410 RepID=UPI002FF26486